MPLQRLVVGGLLALLVLLQCHTSIAYPADGRSSRSGRHREYSRRHRHKKYHKSDEHDKHDSFDGADDSSSSSSVNGRGSEGGGTGGNGSSPDGGGIENGSGDCTAQIQAAESERAKLQTAVAFLSCSGDQARFTLEGCGQYLSPDVQGTWLNWGQPFPVQGRVGVFNTMQVIFYPNDGGEYAVSFANTESTPGGRSVYSQLTYRMSSATSWSFMQKMRFSPEGLIEALESTLDVASLSVGSGRFFQPALAFVSELFDDLLRYGEDPTVLAKLMNKHISREAQITVQLFYDEISQTAGKDDGPVDFFGPAGAIEAFRPLFDLDWISFEASFTSMTAGNRVENGEQRSVSTITATVDQSRWFCNKQNLEQPAWTVAFVIGTDDSGMVDFLEYYTDFGGVQIWASQVCKL